MCAGGDSPVRHRGRDIITRTLSVAPPPPPRQLLAAAAAATATRTSLYAACINYDVASCGTREGNWLSTECTVKRNYASAENVADDYSASCSNRA